MVGSVVGESRINNEMGNISLSKYLKSAELALYMARKVRVSDSSMLTEKVLLKKYLFFKIRSVMTTPKL